MGVSFGDRNLMEISDNESFKNAPFSDFDSVKDFHEDSQAELFRDREDFYAKFNESGQMIENIDFIDFENLSPELDLENAFNF
jgi:hypothetical protein